MKNIQYILSLWTVFILLMGCERRHLEDNLLGSTVYFSRSGLQPATFYDVEGTHDYVFYGVNTGYFRGEADLKVELDVTVLDAYNQENATSLKELPEDCYLIKEDKGTITKDKNESRFVVQFNAERLRALSQEVDYSDLQNYVVPLLLSTEGELPASAQRNQMLVQPDMKQLTVLAESPGEVTVPKSELTGTLTFEFPVKTALENNWETTFDILIGEEAVTRLNSTPLQLGSLEAGGTFVTTPSTAYSVAFEETVQPGTSSSTMTVTVDAAKVPEGCTSIVLWLEGASVLGSAAPVEGKPYLLINLQNVSPVNTAELIPVNVGNADETYYGKYLEQFGYTLLSQAGWNFAPDSYHANSYPSAIDGNTRTIWENRYNDNANSAGPKSTLPFNAIIDLGKVETFNAIELWRRANNANYVSDLKSFEMYVSDDKVNWKYVTTIDYGTEKDQRAMYNFFQTVRARYVNLYMTGSNRSSAVSIAEVRLWTR